MSTEIELKLSLNDKTARKLPAHVLLAELPAQKQALLNTYYDTPALALHARRIAVRFRKKGWQWLLTVKSAEPASGGLAMRSEWEVPANPGEFDFSHVDNDDLRNFLDAHKQHLEAVFTTDFVRRTWHVPYGESTIELALDRGHIDSQGHQEKICEIELELLDGRIEDIFGLTRKLQAELSLYPSIASKAERGYRAFLNAPQEAFRAKPTRIQVDQTPTDAFRCIALNCLEHFQRNESGLTGNDPEFIHQARVALRRMRSAIKLFSPLLPKEFVSAYTRTWKTLASALGEARNWDVFLQETLPPLLAAFPEDKDLAKLRRQAEHRAQLSRRAITKLMSVKEYPRLLVEFTAAIYTLQSESEASLLEFSRKQLQKHQSKVEKLASRAKHLNAEERHQMRIQFKKLRYSLDFFQPLMPPPRPQSALSELSALQANLGRINDHATALELIKTLTPLSEIPQIFLGWIYGQQALLLEQSAKQLNIWINKATPHKGRA